MSVKIPLIILINAISFGACCQLNCQALLQQYFESISRLERPEPGKVYYMDYDIDIKTKAKDAPNNGVLSVNNKIFITDDQYQMESSQMSVYQDKNDVIIIIHPNKTIVWNEGNDKIDYPEQIGKIREMQQLLVEKGTVENCTELSIASEELIKMTFMLDPELQDKYRIRNLSFDFSKKSKELKRATIYYQEDHPYVYQRITYKETDFDREVGSRQPAKSLVFSSDNQLKKEYAGYTLVNNKSN